MNTRGTILALVLIVCTSRSSSSANVTFGFVSRGNPVGSDGTAITGYHASTLRLHSDSGNITAVDFSGSYGFSGHFVQRWTSSGSDGIYDTSSAFSTFQNLANSDLNLDSHMLGTPFTLTASPQAREDATIGPAGTQFGPFPVNSASVGYGQGTYLKGAFGIVAASQSPDLDIAYLVLADQDLVPGYQVIFTAQVATAGGTFDVINPEPTSAALASLVGLGAMSLRRARLTERGRL